MAESDEDSDEEEGGHGATGPPPVVAPLSAAAAAASSAAAPAAVPSAATADRFAPAAPSAASKKGGALPLLPAGLAARLAPGAPPSAPSRSSAWRAGDATAEEEEEEDTDGDEPAPPLPFTEPQMVSMLAARKCNPCPTPGQCASLASAIGARTEDVARWFHEGQALQRGGRQPASTAATSSVYYSSRGGAYSEFCSYAAFPFLQALQPRQDSAKAQLEE